MVQGLGFKGFGSRRSGLRFRGQGNLIGKPGSEPLQHGRPRALLNPESPLYNPSIKE